MGILTNKDELPWYSQAVARDHPPTHSQANELAEESGDDGLSEAFTLRGGRMGVRIPWACDIGILVTV